MTRIDTHHHLLPGVDDGCRDLADSLLNAQIMVKLGYSKLFVTPHFGDTGFSVLSTAAITAGVEKLRAMLAATRTPLEIRPGGELRLDPQLPETLRELGAPTFNFSTNYILVDLWDSTWPDWATRAVEYLRKQGLTVILAHPERMQVLFEKPQFIDELARMGLLFQGTFAPLAGVDHPKSTPLVERYLKEGRYFLLASDAHRPDTLAARMAGLARAVELVGQEIVDQLTITNPARLWT